MRSWLKSAVLCAGILTFTQVAPAQVRPEQRSDGDASARASDYNNDLPPTAEAPGDATAQVAHDVVPHLRDGPRVTYKDTFIGEALAPFLARRKWQCDVDTDARGHPLATTHCFNGDEQIGAGHARIVGYAFLRGLAPDLSPGLYAIHGTFPSGEYVAIRDAFVEKFGRDAQVTRDTITNARGTSYTIERLDWLIGDVLISVQRFDNKGALSSGPNSFDLTQGYFEISLEAAATHLSAPERAAGKL